MEAGFPGGAVVKNPPADAGAAGNEGSVPRIGIPWRRKWQPTPVFLPGKFHGQRSRAGYNPRGGQESEATEDTHTHTHTHTPTHTHTHRVEAAVPSICLSLSGEASPLSKVKSVCTI